MSVSSLRATPHRRLAHPPRGTSVLLATALAVALVITLVGLAPSPAHANDGPNVLISELTNGGPGGNADNFIEIQNFGDEPADIDGWRLHRCTGVGNRNVAFHSGAPFDGLVLDPGETYMVANESSTVADLADAFATSSLANGGFGMVLVDDNRQVVDSVGVYAYPSESDCGEVSLPNDLNGRRAESWQRVDTTGDLHADFIKATRTPNAPNATEPVPGPDYGDVLISEVTNGGPAGNTDNFVELHNYGSEPVDIGGWLLYRCTGVGMAPSTVQVDVPAGTTIEPGEFFIFAHVNAAGIPDDVPQARYDVSSLANLGFGVQVEDADGVIRDSVGVFDTDFVHQPPTDAACTQGDALPNVLDFGWSDSFHRYQETHDNSQDFAIAPRSPGELTVPEPPEEPDPFEFGPVRISEIANGVVAEGQDNFFELANYGNEPVSLEGWQTYRCVNDGRRAAADLVPPLGDTVLEPGETFLAVQEGSPLHASGDYDVAYAAGFDTGGTGLMVLDTDDELVDSVGLYRVFSDVGEGGYSPCNMGLSTTDTLDVAAGYSYQRLQATGVNVDDFVAWPQTPGELTDDLRAPADFLPEELEPVDVDPNPHAGPAVLTAPAEGTEGVGDAVDLQVTGNHTTGGDQLVTVHGAPQLRINDAASTSHTGVSDQAPPSGRIPADEQTGRLPGGDDGPLVSESVDGFPFQRYEVALDEEPAATFEVTWTGRSVNTNELQLYVWSHTADEWELIDAAGGVRGGDITLIGEVSAQASVVDGRLDLLVQDGPPVGPAFSDEDAEPNGAFKDPAEYDFSMVHMTDTQFLSESYRNIYAELNRWIVTNAAARNIAYTLHTGDIIESWTRGTHPPSRAANEMEFASDVTEILEEAGHPHGILPGNHDNRWGRDNELFNTWFPTSRYADQPWFGGSWKPEEDPENKHSHYDVLEINGAEFLVVQIGYYGGDHAVEWANEVIAAYPEHNVIFATHEHIDTHGEHANPDDHRWTSEGQRFWDEIIVPNENVFLVLSGHFHGIATNVVTRDADGDGPVVVELLADYQNFRRDDRRDTGFLRLLQFDLDAKQMAVNAYSPVLDEYHSAPYDPDNRYGPEDDEFTIVDLNLNDRYDKRVEADAVGVQANGRIIDLIESLADGASTTVTWDGLASGTSYAWYADSLDTGTGTTARSTVATFSTIPAPGDDDDDGGDPGDDDGGDPGDDDDAGEPDPGDDGGDPGDDDGGDPVLTGLTRLAGAERIATAVTISQDRFDDEAADAVVLARADDYADALVGAPLTAAVNAPLLITWSDALVDDVRDEIARVLGGSGVVHLVGGSSALDDVVEAQLAELGYAAVRHSGATRVETAVAVAEAIGDVDHVLIATGADFPDALTAGAAAAANRGVVVLTPGDDPHERVDAYLATTDANVWAIGGPASRAYPDAVGVVGAAREETAVAVAEAFFDQPQVFGLARSDDFPDALAGGAHSGANGGPLLVTPTAFLSAAVTGWLADVGAVPAGFVYGGTAAIDDEVLHQIEEIEP